MANNIRSGLTRSVLPQLSSPRPNPNARTPQQALQEMTRIMGSATQKYQFLRTIAPSPPGGLLGGGGTVLAGVDTGWFYTKLSGIDSDFSCNTAFLWAYALAGAPKVSVAVCEYGLVNGAVVATEAARGSVVLSAVTVNPVGLSVALRLSAEKRYCLGIHVSCDGASQAQYFGPPVVGQTISKPGAASDSASFVWPGGSDPTTPVYLGAQAPGFAVLGDASASQAVIDFNTWQ